MPDKRTDWWKNDSVDETTSRRRNPSQDADPSDTPSSADNGSYNTDPVESSPYDTGRDDSDPYSPDSNNRSNEPSTDEPTYDEPDNTEPDDYNTDPHEDEQDEPRDSDEAEDEPTDDDSTDENDDLDDDSDLGTDIDPETDSESASDDMDDSVGDTSDDEYDEGQPGDENENGANDDDPSQQSDDQSDEGFGSPDDNHDLNNYDFDSGVPLAAGGMDNDSDAENEAEDSALEKDDDSENQSDDAVDSDPFSDDENDADDNATDSFIEGSLPGDLDNDEDGNGLFGSMDGSAMGGMDDMFDMDSDIGGSDMPTSSSIQPEASSMASASEGIPMDGVSSSAASEVSPELAFATAASDIDPMDTDMDEISDAAKEGGKGIIKQQIWAFVIANLGWIALIFAVLWLGSMMLVIGINDRFIRMEEEEMQLAGDSGSGGMDIDFSNHNLNADVMALQGDVEREVKAQGLDDQWMWILLGMIQQETGGNVAAYPDVMQSSESQGWPMNTITDPAESIKYGVMAFKAAVDAAASHNINDVRAVLQGYNMNHAFINWMAKEGLDHWTSDKAEWYSMNIVYPAVTGNGVASTANRETSKSPWAVAIGKPYYIRNGGDFHYPNAILHHLGVDYSKDGAISIGDIGSSVVTEGSLKGYSYPIPVGKFHVTSDFGDRWNKKHKGIDIQYNGAMFHQGGPIYAAADGKVIAAGYSDSMGNYVKIDHGYPGKNDAGLSADVSITSTYMHFMHMPMVKAGSMVKAGDQIGSEGNSGNSFGNHLHFQLEQNGVPFDPRKIYFFDPPVL